MLRDTVPCRKCCRKDENWWNCSFISAAELLWLRLRFRWAWTLLQQIVPQQYEIFSAGAQGLLVLRNNHQLLLDCERLVIPCYFLHSLRRPKLDLGSLTESHRRNMTRNYNLSLLWTNCTTRFQKLWFLKFVFWKYMLIYVGGRAELNISKTAPLEVNVMHVCAMQGTDQIRLSLKIFL